MGIHMKGTTMDESSFFPMGGPPWSCPNMRPTSRMRDAGATGLLHMRRTNGNDGTSTELLNIYQHPMAE